MGSDPERAEARDGDSRTDDPHSSAVCGERTHDARRAAHRARPRGGLGPLLAISAGRARTVVDLLFQQRRAASTISELPPDIFRQVVEAVRDDRLATCSTPRSRRHLHLVAELPEERRSAVVGMLPEDRRADLRKAELYPEHSAGRVMNTDFVALDAKMTAQEAIDHIRARGSRGETDAILYLYVVDDERLLQGVVPIRRLVTSAPDRPAAS